MSYVIMMTTVASEENAERIASALVTEKLAACIQSFPVKSRYVWKGELQCEPEILLLIKTRKGCEAGVEARIREQHDYTLPEIISVPIAIGSAAYLTWIDDNTGGETP
jgi:periplasmic divalent cation tolerance protein